ncbi:MAG: hypothetical protein IMX04_05830 [Candidatus Carbobacillus altaicus]|nr:hypothetical protein [Candidatus Carbobacillus altaicus]
MTLGSKERSHPVHTPLEDRTRTTPPRLLLVTENTLGFGHRRAAEALQAAWHTLTGEQALIETTLSEKLTLSYNLIYGQTLQHARFLWGLAYASERMSSRLFRHGFALQSMEKAQHLIKTYRPDIVFVTHALPVTVFGKLKRKGAPFKLAVAVTDFDVNGFWIDKNVDRYYLAHASLIQRLYRRYRVPPHTMLASGMPIFTPPPLDPPMLRKKLDLPTDLPLILIAGGGEGLIDVRKIIPTLDRLNDPFAFIIITGRNEALWRSLQSHRTLNHPLIVKRYVENFLDYLTASDLIISKPGGLTLSEIFAVGRPSILIQPIPGQESRNLKFVRRHATALIAHNIDELTHAVSDLLQSPQKRCDLAQRAAALGNKEAALTIARDLLLLRDNDNDEAVFVSAAGKSSSS